MTKINNKTGLSEKSVIRPWGSYTVLDKKDGYLVKTICINSGQKLSVQYHSYRKEHWFILEGIAHILKGNKELLLKKGDSIDIEVKEIHSIQNLQKAELKILEIQVGEIIDENDIVRISDIYGRK